MRVLAVCSIAVSLVALPAGAQLTQGAVAPSESFSLQDDGTSLGSNPAGLGYSFTQNYDANMGARAWPRWSTMHARSSTPLTSRPARVQHWQPSSLVTTPTCARRV